MRLITNNPAKYVGLAGFGIESISLAPRATPENLRYLATKKRRMGHMLAGSSAE
jgi:3,4-dihydroxy 2-butanone 4-phosphate synthase/GTP cyclohydrolase II